MTLIAVVVILVLFFAPIIPVSYVRGSVLPWAAECEGPSVSTTVPVMASVPFYLTHGNGFGRWGFGLYVVPSSSSPVEFAPYGYPNGIQCG